jgi:hypothetical protein
MPLRTQEQPGSNCRARRRRPTNAHLKHPPCRYSLAPRSRCVQPTNAWWRSVSTNGFGMTRHSELGRDVLRPTRRCAGCRTNPSRNRLRPSAPRHRQAREASVMNLKFAVKTEANDSERNGYMYYRESCSISVMVAGSTEREPIRLRGSLSSEAPIRSNHMPCIPTLRAASASMSRRSPT